MTINLRNTSISSAYIDVAYDVNLSTAQCEARLRLYTPVVDRKSHSRPFTVSPDHIGPASIPVSNGNSFLITEANGCTVEMPNGMTAIAFNLGVATCQDWFELEQEVNYIKAGVDASLKANAAAYSDSQTLLASIPEDKIIRL